MSAESCRQAAPFPAGFWISLGVCSPSLPNFRFLCSCQWIAGQMFHMLHDVSANSQSGFGFRPPKFRTPFWIEIRDALHHMKHINKVLPSCLSDAKKDKKAHHVGKPLEMPNQAEWISGSQSMAAADSVLWSHSSCCLKRWLDSALWKLSVHPDSRKGTASRAFSLIALIALVAFLHPQRGGSPMESRQSPGAG